MIEEEVTSLTPKQEKACVEYLKCHNKTEAYRRAYNCANMKDNTIHRSAHTLFKNPKIRTRLAELSKTASLRNDITIDRILQEYKKIAFTDLPGIINFGKGEMSIEDFQNLNASQKSCIRKFKIKTQSELSKTGKRVPVTSVEVELHDKQHALDMLAKYEGMMVEKKQIEVKEKLHLHFDKEDEGL